MSIIKKIIKMTKTMNEQMEEINKGCDRSYNDGFEIRVLNCKSGDNELCNFCKGRKSQLQTDMKIVEELKEKLKKRFSEKDCAGETSFLLNVIDKLFKEIGI
jgi:hypothetical protein